MKFATTLAPLALGLLGGVAAAQGVGSSLPDEIELDSFAQIPVKSYGDLTGRAVLIEFFAYW